MRIAKVINFVSILLIAACSEQIPQNELNIDERLGVEECLNLEFLDEISPELYNTLLKTPQKLLIIIFDASCSSCLATFFKYLDAININEEIIYLYIGQTQYDLLLVEHYMDEIGFELSDNEFLLPDVSNVFQIHNPSVVSELMPLILLDKDFNIINAISLYDLEDVYLELIK